MKKSIFLVVLAAFICSSAILWAAMKEVSSNSIKHEVETFTTAHYALSKPIELLQIDGPFHVELVEGMSGIEFVGDKDLMKYIHIAVEARPFNFGCAVFISASGSAVNRDDSTFYRTPSEMLGKMKASGISLRCGTLSVGDQKPEHLFLTFKNCIELKTTGTLHAKDVLLVLNEGGVTNLQLDVRDIQVGRTFGILGGNPTNCKVGLGGKARRLIVEKLSDVQFDAKSLETREVYIRNAENSSLNLKPKEIANLKDISNCKIDMENPPYTRIVNQQ